MRLKYFLLTCMVGVMLLASGCIKAAVTTTEKTQPEIQKNSDASHNNTNVNPTKVNDNPTVNSKVRPASLGGICLGDKMDDVEKALGKDYTESIETDESGYIGEDMIVWTYKKGIVVTIGKKSKEVINVVSNSPEIQTDLGIKAGDKAKLVFDKYRPVFKEVKSRHDNSVLTGWFDIGNGIIVIFGFEDKNSTKINNVVEPDSSVQQITMAYWKHFD